MTDPVFQKGDLVTRDGSDVHRVIEEDEGYGNITVLCIKAPVSGWIKVGETEQNLSGRYSYAGDVVDGVATRIAGALPAS